MKYSYNNLWELLLDKKHRKKRLIGTINLLQNTIVKAYINLQNILDKISRYFGASHYQIQNVLGGEFDD